MTGTKGGVWIASAESVRGLTTWRGREIDDPTLYVGKFIDDPETGETKFLASATRPAASSSARSPTR